MKKFVRIFSLILIAVLILSIPAYATEERASLYISSYSMDVLPAGNGKLAVEFAIAGTRQMSAVGVESITIYRINGSSRIEVAEFNRNDTNMIATNSAFHAGTKYYQGIPGEEYKVTVTLFAENSSGYDSRTENFILTV